MKLALRQVNRIDLVDRGDNPRSHVALFKRMEVDEDFDDIVKRPVSSEERSSLASAGKALPDGSFPIANESDLRNAIQAFGRAKDKSAAKAHIIKRAKALGKTSLLPESWNVRKEGSVTPEETKKAEEAKAAEAKKAEEETEAKKNKAEEDNETAEDKLAKVEKELAVEKAAKEKAEAELAKAKEDALTPEQKVEKALESVPEAVKKAVEEQMKDVTKRMEEAETIAKTERDARLNAEFIAKAKTLGPIAKAEELGPVLKTLSEKAPEEFKKVEEALKAAAEQVATANLFKEFGTELDGAGSDAYEKLEAKAEEIRKADANLSKEQAIAKATEMNPELAREYQVEVRKATAGRGE